MRTNVTLAKVLLPVLGLFCFLLPSIGFSQDQPQTEYVNLIDTFDIHCLTPPEGFTEYDGFPGYIHLATSSSISVHVVNNRTIVDAAENLNDEYFRANGLEFISKEEVVVNSGEKGLLYKVSKSSNDELVYQYTLFVGDMNGVLWISGSYFAKYAEVVEKPLLESLMTTKLKR